ncbi:MAG: gamma-glutamyltransferase [Gammaproteobacteria bacterium]|nr:gamma-glutamyltransferase [Gammaproteobacteria bacterium]
MAVATTSQLAADAAAEVADCGGNAVDCAVAASMLSANTEPGVCALAGGAYVTVWHPDKEPITIDGNVAVPGIEAGARHDPDRGLAVQMEYGGGVRTVIGGASIAVPGTLAALEKASQTFGNVNWKDTLQPAIRAAADGFPLSEACHYYLGYSAAPIFSRSADGFKSLHDNNGSLLESGACVVIPHLADSLAAIAAEGARLFYEGDLAARIADHVRAAGGTLTRTDLASYEAIVRPALSVGSNGWRIATNPPPAVGGAMLAAMLQGFADEPIKSWNQEAIAHLVRVQLAALSYRKNKLDLADDVGAAANEMLELATNGQLLSRWSSASTVHTSAVDSNGLACAITASSGYGSGEMPAGTGLWLNNCLGEMELNRHGLAAGPVGARLPSNMAPGVARQNKTVLAFGSPGADRITTALHQFLINYTQIGCDLDEAVAWPRLHIDVNGERPKLSHEPGIDLPLVDMNVVPYSSTNMYFGGVAAAVFDGADRLQAAADPRREGGTFVNRG